MVTFAKTGSNNYLDCSGISNVVTCQFKLLDISGVIFGFIRSFVDF